MALIPMLTLAALPNPTVPIGGQPVTMAEIENIIQGVARFLIIVGVVIAVIFIILGGLRWLTAQGNEKQVAAAKLTLKNGIIGAVIVLGVGVIIQTLAGLITRTFFGSYQ
jgi:hypothetical protein